MQSGFAIRIFRFFWMIGNLFSRHDCPFWDHSCDRMVRLLRPRASPSEGRVWFQASFARAHCSAALFRTSVYTISPLVGHAPIDAQLPGSFVSRRIVSHSFVRRQHTHPKGMPRGGGCVPQRMGRWTCTTARSVGRTYGVSCVVCVGVRGRWWVGSVSFLPSKGQAEASGPMATAPFLNTCPWNRRTRRVGGVSLACVRWMVAFPRMGWVSSPSLSLHPPFWRGTRSMAWWHGLPFPFLPTTRPGLLRLSSVLVGWVDVPTPVRPCGDERRRRTYTPGTHTARPPPSTCLERRRAQTNRSR